MKFTWLTQIVIEAFKPFLGLISNEIKSQLTDFIINLYKNAEKTPNVWDDMFVKLLADILSIKLD